MPATIDTSMPRVEQMYALYQAGATLEEVGERFRISKSRASQLFKAAGLKTRAEHVADRVPAMYALYQGGATLGEVGEQFGASSHRVGELFKAAGLKTRSNAVNYPVQDLYERYAQGATLKEIGEDLGVSHEWVRQLFKAAGLETRSVAQAGELRRETSRLCAEDRRAEIIDIFRQVKDPAIVAERLDISTKLVREVLSEAFSAREYRALRRNQYSEDELFGFLREASARLGGVLSVNGYDEFARGRSTTDGRGWPTHQTHLKRHGSWRNALLAAGLNANPSVTMRSFDTDQCIEAIRLVTHALGKVPTLDDYGRHARRSSGALPSEATIRVRCGGWKQALQMAGVFPPLQV